MIIAHTHLPVFTTMPLSLSTPLNLSQTFLDSGDVTSRILTVLKSFDKVPAAKVTPSSHFSVDLGLDSLDVVEVVMAIESEFAIEIPDAEADRMMTVEDAVKYIASHPQAK